MLDESKGESESVVSESSEGVHAAITPVLEEDDANALQPGEPIDSDSDGDLESATQMTG